MTSDDNHTSIDMAEIDQLRCHETIREERLRTVQNELLTRGVIRHPILVDRDSRVILDGHHRYHALQKFGAKRIPVRFVNYRSDNSIKVKKRSNCPLESLTKDDVITMGLSDDVFPYKTTRHVYEMDVKPVEVPLDHLR